jgi:hypothetical protein
MVNYSEVRRMGYKVWVGNTAIECDSPEDALELARRAESGHDASRKGFANREEQISGGGSRWTEKRVAEFFRLIDGNQRKLIDTLLEHSDGRTDQQLMALLSFNDGRALGGVLGGAWKNAKKIGADPGDLYVKKAATIGGKKAFEYFLTESFRRAAEAHRRGEQ